MMKCKTVTLREYRRPLTKYEERINLEEYADSLADPALAEVLASMAEEVVAEIRRQVRGRRVLTPQLVANLAPSPQLIAKHRRKIAAALNDAFDRGAEQARAEVDAAAAAPIGKK